MIATRLAHAALGVGDLTEAVEFYAETLGLAVLGERGERRYLASGRSATYELALEPHDGGLDHFAFAATDLDTLTSARARMEAAGVDVEDLDVEAEPGLRAGIGFALPSGHAMELVVQEAPSSLLVSSHVSARHHRGVGPVPLEHITLKTHDIEATARFLCDHLGFRITESLQAPGERWRNTFMRAGDLHHDLAMLPNDVDVPELHHVCFAVPSVVEMVRLADRLAAAGIALDASIGRHASGNNVFLYFKDPWHNRLEVNTDMARIDAAAPTLIRNVPAQFDVWREGRPPALMSGAPARDARQAHRDALR